MSLQHLQTIREEEYSEENLALPLIPKEINAEHIPDENDQFIPEDQKDPSDDEQKQENFKSFVVGTAGLGRFLLDDNFGFEEKKKKSKKLIEQIEEIEGQGQIEESHKLEVSKNFLMMKRMINNSMRKSLNIQHGGRWGCTFLFISQQYHMLSPYQVMTIPAEQIFIARNIFDTIHQV